MTKAPAQQGALGSMRQTTDDVGVSALMTGPLETATLLVDSDAGELFEMAHRTVVA